MGFPRSSAAWDLLRLCRGSAARRRRGCGRGVGASGISRAARSSSGRAGRRPVLAPAWMKLATQLVAAGSCSPAARSGRRQRRLATVIAVVWLVGITNAEPPRQHGRARATLAAIACATRLDAVSEHIRVLVALSLGFARGFPAVQPASRSVRGRLLGGSIRVLGFARHLRALFELEGGGDTGDDRAASPRARLDPRYVAGDDRPADRAAAVTQGGRDTSHRLVYYGLSEGGGAAGAARRVLREHRARLACSATVA